MRRGKQEERGRERQTEIERRERERERESYKWNNIMYLDISLKKIFKCRTRISIICQLMSLKKISE